MKVLTIEVPLRRNIEVGKNEDGNITTSKDKFVKKYGTIFQNITHQIIIRNDGDNDENIIKTPKKKLLKGQCGIVFDGEEIKFGNDFTLKIKIKGEIKIITPSKTQVEQDLMDIDRKVKKG